MGVSRVDFAGETLIDLTGDTVNEQSLLSGYTAHNKAGELIQGLAVIPTKLSELENDAGYAKIENPAFTGTPTAPTPPDNTNSTQIATTAYVKKLISNLVNGAPETLDTLKEIADALGENDDAVQALNAAIGNKVDKVAGKGLSTNDFTTAEKNKLAGISNNANNYSLPIASATVRGGVKVGYAENGKNYPVELSNEQMYVHVPWVNTTYSAATQSANGLMTAADKKKLDGIAEGANKTTLINNFFTTEPGLGAADAKTVADLYSQNMGLANSIGGLNTGLKKVSIADIIFYDEIVNQSNASVVYYNDYFAIINVCIYFSVSTHPADNYLPIFDIESFVISRRQDYRVETNWRAFTIRPNGNKTTLYAYVSGDNISEGHAFQWVVLL